MLIDETDGHLASVREFADKVGKRDNLEKGIEFLHSYANTTDEGLLPTEKHKTRCRLMKDFAPQSFYFIMEARDKNTGEWGMWFNCGLIFHGPHDGGGSGGPPTFSVTLSPTDGWSVHT